jgi:hypothetical protein
MPHIQPSASTWGMSISIRLCPRIRQINAVDIFEKRFLITVTFDEIILVLPLI